MIAFLVASVALADTRLDNPRMMDGVAIYAFEAAGVSGRFCFDEADNHFASVFILLVNSASEDVDVRPKYVDLYHTERSDGWIEAERWGPSDYSEHLTHPRSWIGLANLLISSDKTMKSLVTRSRAEYLTPAVVTEEHVETSPSTMDRLTSKTLRVLRRDQPNLDASSVTNGLVPAQSEDMLLRSTSLVPGASVFGAVPFKVKVRPGTSFRVRIAVAGRTFSADVAPRE